MEIQRIIVNTFLTNLINSIILYFKIFLFQIHVKKELWKKLNLKD